MKTVETIISEMSDMKTRKEGAEYLAALGLKKTAMFAILKKMDVPFRASESTEKIRQKIIEGTIGFRIRSKAIQGF